MKKRFWALFLAVMMIVSVLPTTAFAAEEDELEILFSFVPPGGALGEYDDYGDYRSDLGYGVATAEAANLRGSDIRNESIEENITKYVASWPGNLSAEAYKAFEAVRFGMTNYSGEEYEITWVNICYRTGFGTTYRCHCSSSLGAHIHIDGILSKKVQPAELKLRKVIEETQLTEETFYFSLNRLHYDSNMNPTNRVDTDFVPIGLSATIDIGETSADIVYTGSETIGFGYYKLTEAENDKWDCEPVYIQIATDGSLKYCDTYNGRYITAGSTGVEVNNTLKRYEVTYDANGGTGEPEDQTKVYGETLKLSSEQPTLADYNFIGWNTRKDGKGVSYAAGDEYTDNADLKLYAQWEPIHVCEYEPVVTKPTCTEGGYTTYTCSCGDSYVADRVPALGHDMGAWEEYDEEEHIKKCSRCDHTETAEHVWDNGVVNPAATCEGTGTKTYTCSDCGETKTETLPALGHDMGAWKEYDEDEHIKECSRCDHTETAEHVWGDWAKCEGDPLTEERICGDCGAKEYRDVDEKGKLDGGKEIGDGIGDKYQVFVWYKAGANGSLTGEIYKAYTLGKEGDAELRKEVTLTYPTTVPYSGYAFDKWILPAQVTINGTTMSNFQVGTTYTFTATFGADSKGNLDGDKETGDGTPDKYQVFVWYKAGDNGSLEGKTYYAYDLRINGTTELRSTVSLNYPTPVARHGFDFDGWLEPADVVISEDTMSQFTVGETYVFTAMFSRDRGDRPAAEPTVKVKGLNSDDHVAYVVGRGEGMFDPMGKVTRAEVATIYFRLMTEEFRTEFWTDVNSFSDVVGTDWYNVAISTLENAGVIQDTVTGGEFRPNDPITRAELAVMAAQFATVTGKIPETSFKDVDKDYWAYDEIKLIECAGWIEGYRGYFRPDDNLTRAECVTIVNRMLKRGAEEDNMLEDMVIFLDNLDQDMWYYEAIQEAANSHDYTRTKVKLEGENFNGEIWTVLLDAPDWAALEQAWSQAHVE